MTVPIIIGVLSAGGLWLTAFLLRPVRLAVGLPTEDDPPEIEFGGGASLSAISRD